MKADRRSAMATEIVELELVVAIVSAYLMNPFILLDG